MQAALRQTRIADRSAQTHVPHLDCLAVGALRELYVPARIGAGDPLAVGVLIDRARGGCASHGDWVDEAAPNEAEEGIEIRGEDGWGGEQVLHSEGMDDPRIDQLLEAMNDPQFVTRLAAIADDEGSPRYPFGDRGKRLWRRTNTTAGTVWLLDEYWAA